MVALRLPFFRSFGGTSELLNPFLLSLFIHDVPSLFTCPGLLYSDDLKLFSVDSLTDQSSRQSNFDRLCRWCVRNKLSISVKKCYSLYYTLKTATPIYHSNGQPITVIASESLLHLTTNFDLIFIMQRTELRECLAFSSVSPTNTWIFISKSSFIIRSPDHNCGAIEFGQKKFTLSLNFRNPSFLS